jgi:hypothetical protein
MGQRPLLPSARGGEQLAGIFRRQAPLDPVHHDIDSQPALNMLLYPRQQPRPSKVGLAMPPASTLSRYIALVSARRPPIVTLFDQVGAVVSVGRGSGSTLWSSLAACIAKLRPVRQCYEGSLV